MLSNYSIVHKEIIDSTNSFLKKEMLKGRIIRGVVSATEQTKGRGRGNNDWISNPGGLFISVGFPVLDKSRIDLIGPAAALGILKLLSDKFGIKCRIKWPNDILFDGKKLGGFLLELIETSPGLFSVIIGFGMNINYLPEYDSSMFFKPASLNEILGKTLPDIHEITKEVSEIFAKIEQIDNFEYDNIVYEIKKYSATLNEEVSVILPGGNTITGIAVDITDHFALMVEADGVVSEIRAGDCIHNNHFNIKQKNNSED